MAQLYNAYIESRTSTSVSINLEFGTSGQTNVTYYFRFHAQGYEMDAGVTFSTTGRSSTIVRIGITQIDGFNFTADCFVGRSFSESGNWIRVSNETRYTATDEYFPTYYPIVKDQWVYAAGAWQGQVGNCVAQAITTLKEIHEYRERGNTNYYSTGWVFGNRLSTDSQSVDGMMMTEALKRLLDDGVPQYHLLPENNATGSFKAYPDNYYYDDKVISGKFVMGAKTLVQNNKLRPYVVADAINNQIASYSRIPYRQYTINSIKQAIKADGGVIIEFSIAQNFDWLNNYTSNGVVPKPDRWRATRDWHTIVMIGWKLVNGLPHWIAHNNWGYQWGDVNRDGICYIPFDYSFIENAYKLTDVVRIVWKWVNPKVSGGNFNMLATEWNDFTKKINATRSLYDANHGTYIGSYPFTKAVYNAPFEAYYYRQAVTAISAMNPPVPAPPLRYSGDTIFASDINRLRDALNSVV